MTYKMTANKRKRGREEEVEEGQQQQLNPLQVNALPPPEGGQVKPPQLKKPHTNNNNPPGIITAALDKIAELEKLMNQVDDDEEEDDDDNYHSDYSDSSESGGRFDANSVDNGNPVIRADVKFNPEIVGFAICAQETMNFLRLEGFAEDNPLIRSMQGRLLDQLNQYQATLNRGVGGSRG